MQEVWRSYFTGLSTTKTKQTAFSESVKPAILLPGAAERQELTPPDIKMGSFSLPAWALAIVEAILVSAKASPLALAVFGYKSVQPQQAWEIYSSREPSVRLSQV